MAWTAPPTFSNGAVLTAAQLDILVADIEETAPAKATNEGSIFVATAANSIAERDPVVDIDNTKGTAPTSSVFGDLTGSDTGPEVTAATGTAALVMLNAHMLSDTAGSISRIGYAVSGASTVSANNNRSYNYEPGVANRAIRRGFMSLHEGLTAGNNTFTMKYKTNTGTLTVKHRYLAVVGF